MNQVFNHKSCGLFHKTGFPSGLLTLMFFVLILIFLPGCIGKKQETSPAPVLQPSPNMTSQVSILQDEWNMFLANKTHTGFSGSPPVKHTKPVAIDTGAPVMGSPAFRENNAFITSMNGFLFCINFEKTPKVAWKCRIGHKAVTTPAIDNKGNIYAGSQDKFLYRVSPKGAIDWKFETGGPIASSTCILTDGCIVFSSMDGNLYCLAPEGNLKWKAPINHSDLEIMSSPAADSSGNISTGSDDGSIYSFDNKGKLRWKYNAGDAVVSSPLIDSRGFIYAGAINGRFFCLTPEGIERWTVQAEGSIESSPVITKDNLIVFGSRDKNLYALDTSGKLIWKRNLGAEIDASAASDAEGNIYTATEKGEIHTLNSNGTIINRIKPGGAIFSSPAVYKGICTAGSEDGKVYFVGK